MSRLWIRGGRVVDPANGTDGVGDVYVVDGVLQPPPPGTIVADEVIDAGGQWVVPGLVDMHVHFREPGNEEAETIASGAMAAVAGGFTSVACMPNTQPALDVVVRPAVPGDVVQDARERARRFEPRRHLLAQREGGPRAVRPGLLHAGGPRRPVLARGGHHLDLPVSVVVSDYLRRGTEGLRD